jgi:hypothetical protein
MSKLKAFFTVIRDLFFIALVEYLPNRFYLAFYKECFLKIIRRKKFNQPTFMSIKSLQDLSILRSKEILHTSVIAYECFADSKNRNTLKYESKTDANSNLKKAKIIIPDNWSNPLSVEGRTQGPQILFLKEGLEQNGFATEIIQLNRNSSSLDNNLLESQLVFIWSLTYFDPDSSVFNIFCSPILQASKKPLVVGVITASPNKDQINRYQKWTRILKKVLYYEEKSDFKKTLDIIFEVTHTQYIQLTPNLNTNQKDFSVSVHASCLLKQNRVAWLLVLRNSCISLKIPYFIRLMSNAVSYKNIRGTYISNELIVEERIKFTFGFVMIHRDHKTDASLIGSFWDYYRLGIIPLVQMQNIREMASYLIPYLDYFPFENDLDLYGILAASKNNPDHFNLLKKRIVERMRYEFNSEAVVKRMLFSLDCTN